jgi:hypothetical protein
MRAPADLNPPDLLPTPFHSTQRRVKNSQNQNASQLFVSLKLLIRVLALRHLQTPARPKKMFAPPTPGESPVFSLAPKLKVVLNPTTPARPPLPIFLPGTPVSPVGTKATLPPGTDSKPKALCAACSRALTSAALLSPCSHLVCSQCFTGACKDCRWSFPFPYQHIRAVLIGLYRLAQRGWGKAYGLYGVQDAHRELPAY